METTLTIFKAIAFTSIIASALFLSAKLYAYFVRKEDECSDDCSCQAFARPMEAPPEPFDLKKAKALGWKPKMGTLMPTPINDQITDSVTAEKPKRKPAKKRVSAIKNDKLVIAPVEEKPKRGRKKKS